ncbi:polyadenylate-binding protein 4-like [Lolium rigidum]|uniref:polyadenylate-binding protein 4-like n=1 Tax=Lolium rigidum TaxID=89674 RepID=UPI001F5C6C69|nr:polyadenylate-binding protein 4-like [Lolium rigidum]
MARHPLLVPIMTPSPLRVAEPAVGSTASLYVGDLEKGVTEGQLYSIFSQVAPVVSLRICRDIAGRSLGYGYVNFHLREDANRALEYLNFTPINGNSIRVMFSNRDPTLRRNGMANVFIKNLEVNIDNKGLNDMFSSFGTILSSKVATYLNGQSKGYGFVQFTNEKSAMDAINGLNGTVVNGKQIFVSLFIRRQERQNIQVGMFTNVYIKNIPKEFTDDNLRQEFAPFGEITSVLVMRDADGSSRCFGFVNYKRSECAIEAIKNLNGKMVNDLIMYVGRAQKKEERQAELKAKFERERNEKFKQFEGLNLYMKNLDDSIGDVHLRNLFENFGEIGSCKVMVDSHGRSKGYGFVSFKTVESINEMNGKLFGRKRLYICVAQRKEERRAILQMVHPIFNQDVTYMNGAATAAMVPLRLSTSIVAHGFTQTDITVPSPYIANNNNALASVDAEKQHEILGEKLYSLVEQVEPEFAAKVTGMLLEMEKTEVLHLIESASDLRVKISQAIEALQQRKVEEFGDAADLASALSSSNASHDTTDLDSAPSPSSVSDDSAELASAPLPSNA